MTYKLLLMLVLALTVIFISIPHVYAAPTVIMSDTTASFASLISTPRQFIGELATPTSVLVGKPIDSITLKLQKVGAPTGTAQVGVFDINRNVVKLFGTIDVSTISTTATDYEFKLLSTDPVYTIQSGDRIGIKYTGGSATVGVNVTPDRVAADPFDGANSYRVRYEAAWITSTTEDMYMILKQTGGSTPIPFILLNPSSGIVSSTVNISGNNFAPLSTISIKFNGVIQTTNPVTITSNSTGGFTGSITVPASGTGPFSISATDASSSTASSQFTVNSSVSTTVMSDTTASFASLISAPRQFIGELATPTSVLVGKPIDSITLKLQKVGAPTGTAQVGVFDINRNVVKLFGTIDVSTISTTATDYEFKLLSTDPLYAIASGDRIGFKYTGGSATVGVNVTPDRVAADPFDGANSYRVRYEAAWITSTTEDMYMILKQTNSIGCPTGQKLDSTNQCVPLRVSLIINSTNLTGLFLPNIYTTIKTSNGTVLVAANTPIKFSADYGTKYIITPEISDIFTTGTYQFDHWHDGNITRVRNVTPTSNTTLVENYKQIPSAVTGSVNSMLLGNESNSFPLSGIYMKISPTSATAESGYTPQTYSLMSNTTLIPNDYGSYAFDHWNDGNTTRARTINFSYDSNYTVYFKTLPVVNDTLNPTVSILSPSFNQVLTSSSPTISGISSDNIGVTKVEVSIDGGDYKTVEGLEKWSFGTNGLINGNHTVSVKASDLAGNSNTTSTSFSLKINPILNRTALYVPMYMYPSNANMKYYDSVINAKLLHPALPIIVNLNPSSGVGTIVDLNYLNVINKLKAANVTVVGYVFTKYGSRDIGVVKSQIYNWVNWYNVDGIHLDEFANRAGYEAYYSEITNYSKTHGLKLIIGNAGTDPPQSYIGTVDMIGITEGSGYAPISYLQYCVGCTDLTGYHYKFDKNNFFFMRYAVDKLDPQNIIEDKKWVGMFYLTDGLSPQRWDHLPSYFNELVLKLDEN